jgi:hypothetical protein
VIITSTPDSAFFKKLPPYTPAGFDLTTLSSQVSFVAGGDESTRSHSVGKCWQLVFAEFELPLIDYNLNWHHMANALMTRNLKNEFKKAKLKLN